MAKQLTFYFSTPATREVQRLKSERYRRQEGVLPRTPCPCLPCVAERLYQSLRREGDPQAYVKGRAVSKDYDPSCPCNRCAGRVQYYHNKYESRKKPSKGPKLTKLDLIALRDPQISQGRPQHYGN